MSAIRDFAGTCRLRVGGARRLLAGAALLTGLLVPFSSAAQISTAATADRPDARWTPWIGCWTLQTNGALALPDDAAGLRACITPTGDSPAAVTFWTLAEDRVVLKETIVADGARRPVEESGCRGWREAAWSHDGERLFTRAELQCRDEPLRKVSGLSVMTRGPVWVDVQAIEAGGRESVRIRRYRTAPIPGDVAGMVLPEPFSGLPAGPPAGAPAMSLDDLVEASRNATAKVVESAVAETQAGFDLDGRALLALDEAGVPGSVIDLVVALSFPEHFRVDRSESGADWSGAGGWSSPFDPFGAFASPWSANYGSYAYLSPYYFSPFGYSYWWSRFDPIPVVPGTGAGGDTSDERGARAVDGLGYTRVRPRTESAPSGSARRRGDSGSAAGGSTSSGGSSGSSGGSVSTKGYSSGGSGTDSGGRTAQPRKP